ncbi:MAG: hypothetical protein J6N52_00395 [Clostridia bacterium]|nr:hypothetical protein [Clostridia bacterium]
MACCKKFHGIDISLLTCKVFGILTFSFCLGTVVGMFMPIALVAVIETILLVLLAYFCLFRW